MYMGHVLLYYSGTNHLAHLLADLGALEDKHGHTAIDVAEHFGHLCIADDLRRGVQDTNIRLLGTAHCGKKLNPPNPGKQRWMRVNIPAVKRIIHHYCVRN